MSMRTIATAAAVVALTFVGAPAALANSFTDTSMGGGGKVTYDDGADSLCVSLASTSGYDVISLTASPVTAGRGPTLSFSVYRGHKTCKSLATAYEDTKYEYSGILGYDPPCRCGQRFGIGTFFS
jgi:hypothetical protein